MESNNGHIAKNIDLQITQVIVEAGNCTDQSTLIVFVICRIKAMLTIPELCEFWSVHVIGNEPVGIVVLNAFKYSIEHVFYLSLRFRKLIVDNIDLLFLNNHIIILLTATGKYCTEDDHR